MKLLRYGPKGSEKPGVLDDDGGIRDLSGVISDIDSRFLGGETWAEVLGLDPSALPLVSPDSRLGAPVSSVGKFICVGLNYADHAKESGMELPTQPVLFMKATSAVSGPFDDVVLPKYSEKADWEVELGVVIGREARYVSLEAAPEHVAGYCVVNDLSERKFQLESGGQWVKGKSCDTFGPIGPYLVTRDEVPDANGLPLWLELNGKRVQDGNTRTMVFDVPYLVHYISHYMSLQPGDFISTGTPPGVGLGMTPPTFLKEGDVMRLGIPGLGEQQQKVVSYAGA
ncbi:MAG TPA: fumarylacetoacetate hydrolase family protein [Acidobacteriota bacterium]|nr:fumarylacetoacetate hydrolase family protein [Acidobacteriota bacterium]